MKIPTQVTFRNVDHSLVAVARIETEAAKLEKYFDRITSCRVLVEKQHRHQQGNGAFHVRIELGVPGKELVVGREPGSCADSEGQRNRSKDVSVPHHDLFVAIRDAFMAMRRQLQDYAHCLRKEVKRHLEHAGRESET